MGKVLNTKASGNKIVYTVELSENEALQLRNHMKRVYLFCADLCTELARVIEKGYNRSAKYFAIPFGLKSRKRQKFGEISYQKIETPEKVFFICIAEKDVLN